MKKAVKTEMKPKCGHNPNKRRCDDFHYFMRRLKVIKNLTW